MIRKIIPVFFLPFFLLLFLQPVHALAKDSFLSIESLTSPGGITFWYVEDRSVPIIAMSFAFKGAGTKNDPEDKQGLVRLASNTMDEGAGDLDSQAFQKALSDHSITLRFDASRDNFSGTLRTLKKNQDKAYALLTLALTSPRFDPAPLDRMKNANLARIKTSMAEPDWISARLVNDLAYENEPYALNSGGTLSSLPRITPADLKAYHKDYITKDRLVIGLTGDLSKKEAEEAVDRIFAQLPKTGAPKTGSDFTMKNPSITALYKKDIPQTLVHIVLPGIRQDDPDYYPFLVMNQIFGSGGFGSRLMEEVREKRGLTYGIYSNLSRMDHTQTFNISASTRNDQYEEMMRLVKKEMLKIKSTPVSDKELKDAKAYLTGSFPLSLSSTAQIASVLLGLQLDHLPINYLDHRTENINAVTKDDIMRIAARILKEDTLLTVLVGAPENVKTDKIIEVLPNVN